MIDLRTVAGQLTQIIDDHNRPEYANENPLTVQVLCASEEMGEMVGAYRRWAGLARRKGTKAELEDEVADVLISTAMFAHRVGIDIDTAIENKLEVIYSRGWREEDNLPS